MDNHPLSLWPRLDLQVGRLGCYLRYTSEPQSTLRVGECPRIRITHWYISIRQSDATPPSKSGQGACQNLLNELQRSSCPNLFRTCKLKIDTAIIPVKVKPFETWRKRNNTFLFHRGKWGWHEGACLRNRIPNNIRSLNRWVYHSNQEPDLP